MILPPGRRVVKSSSVSSSSLHHHTPISECLLRCCLSTLSFCFVFARQKRRNLFKSKRVLFEPLCLSLLGPKRRERESFDSVIKTREEKQFTTKALYSSSRALIKRLILDKETTREICVFLRKTKGRKIG